MANYRLRIGHSVGYPIIAGAGSYTLSGQNATLTYSGPIIGDAYTWYPLLDKSIIPFHAGSGVWGAQSTIKESAPPNGPFTDVTVNSVAELEAQLYTPGRRITIGTNITTTNFYDTGPIADIDIIIPPGRVLKGMHLGAGTTVNRVRIRGNTVGSLSGGQLHDFWLQGTGADFTIDGVHCSNNRQAGALNLGPAAGFNRCGVVNCQINCGGFGIGSTCADLVVANCSISTGMDTAAQTDPDFEEAYGIRCYFETNGNIVLYGNDIRSNPARSVSAHARFRCHPDTGIGYVWAKNNTFVERVENWIFWVDASAGGGSGIAPATWFDTNTVVSTGTGTSGSQDVTKLMGNDTSYAYVQNNSFFSDNFTSDSTIGLTGTVNGSTGRSGNTYQALSADPSWGAVGDPTGIDWTI